MVEPRRAYSVHITRSCTCSDMKKWSIPKRILSANTMKVLPLRVLLELIISMDTPLMAVRWINTPIQFGLIAGSDAGIDHQQQCMKIQGSSIILDQTVIRFTVMYVRGLCFGADGPQTARVMTETYLMYLESPISREIVSGHKPSLQLLNFIFRYLLLEGTAQQDVCRIMCLRALRHHVGPCQTGAAPVWFQWILKRTLWRQIMISCQQKQQHHKQSVI